MKIRARSTKSQRGQLEGTKTENPSGGRSVSKRDILGRRTGPICGEISKNERATMRTTERGDSEDPVTKKLNHGRRQQNCGKTRE